MTVHRSIFVIKPACKIQTYGVVGPYHELRSYEVPAANLSRWTMIKYGQRADG
jgi:hypothetical protein